MATYEVNFPALQAGAANLEETIGRLQAEMTKLNEIQETMLNDSLWYGPNKSKYTQGFNAYKAALADLYMNATDHLTKLQEIMTAYANAEMN